MDQKRERSGSAAAYRAAGNKNYSVYEIYARSSPPLRDRKPVTHRPVKVLIVGAGSYIGTNTEQYLLKRRDYTVHTLDAVGLKPDPKMFRHYDTVFFVAGIAHQKETRRNAYLYYKVNRDLAVRTAECVKMAGVPHFIILSSMSVYGLDTGCITKHTRTGPKSSYGRSKLQADEMIWDLRDSGFRTAVLRPPMVYGNGCKGNYQLLRKLSLAVPVFPAINNERSMIYIGNLCAFIKEVIDDRREGIFLPQNGQYVNTGELASRIAVTNGRKMVRTRIFNPIICSIPSKTIRKVFGSLIYKSEDTVNDYRFDDSVSATESRIV